MNIPSFKDNKKLYFGIIFIFLFFILRRILYPPNTIRKDYTLVDVAFGIFLLFFLFSGIFLAIAGQIKIFKK